MVRVSLLNFMMTRRYDVYDKEMSRFIDEMWRLFGETVTMEGRHVGGTMITKLDNGVVGRRRDE